MTLDDILIRINEIEQMKQSMDTAHAEKRVLIAQKSAELVGLQEDMASNIFDNRDEATELRELKIAKKWLER